MAFLPEDDLKAKISLNLAPMIDFLFLMLVFFASLAISRIMTLDTDIQLARVQSESKSERAGSYQKAISLSISPEGKYNWITSSRNFEVATAEEISRQLLLQHRQGQIPQDKSKTEIFVKIDRNAKWEAIIALLSAVRQAGFSIYALYEPEIT